MKIRYVTALALGSLLVLTGCAAQAPQRPADPDGATGAVAASEGDATSGASALASITSCDQVADAVAPFIENLVPMEDNAVDEWGVTCSWEAAEDETDFANNRSVEVGIAPNESGTPMPDPSLVTAMDGGALIEDAWVSDNDGVAFSLTMGTAVAGVTATTVWFPGFQANITGGTWGDYPALDGPAAVQIVKTLLPNP